MTPDWREKIEIPGRLDEAIAGGMDRGRRTAARRRRFRRWAVNSALSLALVLGLLAGGVRLSPAFAAALDEVPVLGTLVRAFQPNAGAAGGGTPVEGARAELTMERSGDRERMTLTYGRAEAGEYRVRFDSYPKTITLTLPGTEQVSVLSVLSRAEDTSRYVKSVWQLTLPEEGVTVVQLELENDAGVQIREYRDPGSVVVTLEPAEIDLTEVCSLRSLSLPEEAFLPLLSRWGTEAARPLRDDGGLFFLEFGQFGTREAAEAASGAYREPELLAERRTGNNVPVGYESLDQYRAALLLEDYYRLLLRESRAEPLLAFLDAHWAEAGTEEREEMLRGLSGFLAEGTEENAALDWARIEAYYAAAGMTPPERVQK